MGGKAAPSAPDEHYHYLDALRGIFMLGGVFVHASTLGDDPIFNGIAYASGLFRMADFFLISGFLSAMLVGKYGPARTVRRRLASVGIPFVSTLVLLNPTALWLSYNFHNPDVSFLEFLQGHTVPEPAGELRWLLQLWFLVALLVYALCTPAAVTVLSRVVSSPVYRRATTGRPRVMATIIISVMVGTILIRGGYRAAVVPAIGSDPLDLPVEETLDFLPFFLLGVLLYLDRRRLLPAFQRPAPILLAVAGVLLLAATRGWVGGLASSTGVVLSRTLFTVAITVNLFAVASRLVPGPRPAVRYLSDASYTVYLFHYFWIYVIATLLSFDPSLRWPQMLLVTTLTFGVTFALHHFVILRSPFLRKIFNGKFPAGARSEGRHGDRRPAAARAVGSPTATAAGSESERTQPLRWLPPADHLDPERTQQLRWIL
ncbi:putative acyltransferase [Frankia torreyi]|uniref:Putative acyltransferase n=1 Tax=Frankia torreyi TaxID=1856 RepID=A0A0D8BAW2_9ACTN|nr:MULTISPECIES: glucans biosynthesis protein MdoC [Frankia]KJE21403.1 putative acyltransferase [Frankia torreyi]KQC38598.1 glucan biosynthesis protein [Frankia sp. ACN1ag]